MLVLSSAILGHMDASEFQAPAEYESAMVASLPSSAMLALQN